jgi:4-hydroxy-2-oxoheptanedioate aldolase
MNRAREKLRRGGTVLVFNPDFPSPALVEHVGALGFDVAFIDCEHGTADFERVEELARAARAGGMTSILRPWSAEPGLVTRYLDCGVGGIQFPQVDSAEAARALLDIVRRARRKCLEDTLITAMIESREGVENIDAIVGVTGLDAVVVGMADLTASLGHPGEAQHPQVQRAVGRIIAAAAGSGRVAAGFNLHRWEQGPALMKQGVRWFTLHAETMLARGTRELKALLGDTSASG